MPMAECIFERSVQYVDANVEEALDCQMREYLPWSVEISCHSWGSGFTDDEAFASGIDDGFGDQEHAIDL
jgi:hypothetical protein